VYILYGANIIHRILSFSGLDRIHGWWCDKGCGPPVSLPSARNPLFMDFATLRAQWDNVVKYCATGQGANTSSEFVLRISFALKQWLQKRVSSLRFTYKNFYFYFYGPKISSLQRNGNPSTRSDTTNYTCYWLRNMLCEIRNLQELKASVILTYWLKKFTYLHRQKQDEILFGFIKTVEEFKPLTL